MFEMDRGLAACEASKMLRKIDPPRKGETEGVTRFALPVFPKLPPTREV